MLLKSSLITDIDIDVFNIVSANENSLSSRHLLASVIIIII